MHSPVDCDPYTRFFQQITIRFQNPTCVEAHSQSQIVSLGNAMLWRSGDTPTPFDGMCELVLITAAAPAGKYSCLSWSCDSLG